MNATCNCKPPATCAFCAPLKPLTMWEIQIQSLLWTIEKHKGCKRAAAKELEIGLVTVYRWLKKHERLESLKAQSAQRSAPPSHVNSEGSLQ